MVTYRSIRIAIPLVYLATIIVFLFQNAGVVDERSLLQLQTSFKRLDVKYKTDRDFQRLRSMLLNSANRFIQDSRANSLDTPFETGLDQARRCQVIVFHSTAAYFLTGDIRYAVRARDEILMLSNPEVYPVWSYRNRPLALSEMSTCFALGYYFHRHQMSATQRGQVIGRLMEAGVRPTVRQLDTLFGKGQPQSNWTGVTLGGLLATATLLANDPYLPPDFADQSALIYESYAKYIPGILDRLEADGVWDESVSYFNYMGRYLSLSLQLFNEVTGKRHPIVRDGRLVAGANFAVTMTGPNDLKPFNFADGSAVVHHLLAQYLGLTVQRQRGLAELARRNLVKIMDRNLLDVEFLPLALLWYQPVNPRALINKPLMKVFRNTKGDFFAARSSWTDPGALFVAGKGGSAQFSHAQLDMGSFVIEGNGERWVDDLGRDSYSLENYFYATPNLEDNDGNNRWQYFRTNSLSHNVLTFDGRLQMPSGVVKAIGVKETFPGGYISLNMTPAYTNSTRFYKRSFFLRDSKSIRVTDTFAAKTLQSVRWGFVTCGKAYVLNGNSVTLTSPRGQVATLEIRAPANAKLKVESLNARLALNNRQSPQGALANAASLAATEFTNDGCVRIAATFPARTTTFIDVLFRLAN